MLGMPLTPRATVTATWFCAGAGGGALLELPPPPPPPQSATSTAAAAAAPKQRSIRLSLVFDRKMALPHLRRVIGYRRRSRRPAVPAATMPDRRTSPCDLPCA